MTWHIISLAVFLAVALAALDLHHRRGLRKIRHEQYLADGWARRRTPLGNVLICPRCRNPVFSWADVRKHMGEESPCGVLLNADYVLKDQPPPEPPWHAEQVNEPGGVDTWQDAEQGVEQ